MRIAVRIGVFAMVALSAAPARADETALDSLVANERAFSAISLAKGMKEAFLTYLAKDGLMFQPRAVNGRKVWEGRPASTATLKWEPALAAVSSSGDFGYSTGPWEYRPPADTAGTPSPPESFLYGQFNSIWMRQKGIGWRVVADIGVNHSDPGRRGVGNGGFTPGPTLRQRTMKSRPVSLPDEDERLSKAMRAVGPREALNALGATDLRVNTEGKWPAVGLEAAQARYDSLGGFFEFITEGSQIARSGDLGYTYGIAPHFRSANAAPADTSVFLHVWRLETGRSWRLALAVINPMTRR